MVDLESVVNSMPEHKLTLLPALKILVDLEVFSQLAHLNTSRMVDERMDSDVDEDTLAKEIREARQTNRILFGLQETARKLTEGMENA